MNCSWYICIFSIETCFIVDLRDGYQPRRSLGLWNSQSVNSMRRMKQTADVVSDTVPKLTYCTSRGFGFVVNVPRAPTVLTAEAVSRPHQEAIDACPLQRCDGVAG